MKKMFGKSKKEDDNDDANRSALFGSRKKESAPAPAASPYATNNYNTPPSNNSYASQNSGYGAPQNNSYGQANSGYGAPQRGGYTENMSYGAAPEPSSYGSAPEPKTYGGVPEPKAYGMSHEPRGYGGSRAPLSRNDSNSTYDSNRDALFGNRQQQQMMTRPPPQDTYAGAESTGAGAYAQSGGYAQQGQSYNPEPRQYNSLADPYNTGEDRTLTAEEEEEEDVDALKQQIRFTKQASLASTENTLRAAAAAEETGRNTLARLGEQGEKLHNTEVNLNLSKNHGRIAEAKAKELKTLNRSMFAVHVANPFNSQSRAEQKQQDILAQQAMDREERDQSRAAAFQSRQRVGGALGSTGPGSNKPRQKMSLAEKARFQFEADEEDDQMEEQIDANLGAIGDAAARLKMLALATSSEVDDQNRRIQGLSRSTEQVDDQIALNTARLKRFGA